MISYASVDRIEEEFVACEVELIKIEESKPENFATKPTEMMDFPLEKIPYSIGTVIEGDIFVVEHNEENIVKIFYKEFQEKERRLEILRKMRK